MQHPPTNNEWCWGCFQLAPISVSHSHHVRTCPLFVHQSFICHPRHVSIRFCTCPLVVHLPHYRLLHMHVVSVAVFLPNLRPSLCASHFTYARAHSMCTCFCHPRHVSNAQPHVPTRCAVATRLLDVNACVHRYVLACTNALMVYHCTQHVRHGLFAHIPFFWELVTLVQMLLSFFHWGYGPRSRTMEK